MSAPGLAEFRAELAQHAEARAARFDAALAMARNALRPAEPEPFPPAALDDRLAELLEGYLDDGMDDWLTAFQAGAETMQQTMGERLHVLERQMAEIFEIVQRAWPVPAKDKAAKAPPPPSPAKRDRSHLHLVPPTEAS